MFVESLKFCRVTWPTKGRFTRFGRVHSPMILTKTLFFLLPSNSP